MKYVVKAVKERVTNDQLTEKKFKKLGGGGEVQRLQLLFERPYRLLMRIK